MSFTIEYIKDEIIKGKKYEFMIPKGPVDFIAVNQQKEKILPMESKNVVRTAIINDDKLPEGNYYYLVENNNETDTFQVPDGDYASLTGSWTSLGDIDTLIGAGYGEIMQSDEYTIAGTYNVQLIDFVNKQVNIKIPVAKK